MIIVVPHAVLDSAQGPKGHPFDYAARRMAEIIYRMAPEPKFIISADKPRAELDLNRIQSRNSAFRDRIRGAVKKVQSMGLDPVIYEIHSFPPTDLKYGYKAGKQVAVTILSLRGQSAADLVRFLASKNINTQELVGSDKNDIQLEFRNSIKRSYLIEINEAAKNSHEIAAAFVAFMTQNRLALHFSTAIFLCLLLVVCVAVYALGNMNTRQNVHQRSAALPHLLVSTN